MSGRNQKFAKKFFFLDFLYTFVSLSCLCMLNGCLKTLVIIFLLLLIVSLILVFLAFAFCKYY